MKVVKLENIPNLFSMQNGNIQFNAAARRPNGCEGGYLDYVLDENYAGTLPSTPDYSWWVGYLTRKKGPFDGGIPLWDSSKPPNQQNPKIWQFIQTMSTLYGLPPLNKNGFPNVTISDQNQWIQYLTNLVTATNGPGTIAYCEEWKKEIRNFENSKVLRDLACDFEECLSCTQITKGAWGNALCIANGAPCRDRKIWVCNKCINESNCTKDKSQEPCWKCVADKVPNNNGKYCQEVDNPPDGIKCITPTPSPTPSPSPSPSPTRKNDCNPFSSCQEQGFAENCSCKNSQGEECDGGDLTCSCECECDCLNSEATLDPSCYTDCCCGDPPALDSTHPFCVNSAPKSIMGLAEDLCPTPTPLPTPTVTPTPATPTPTPPLTYGI